MRLRTELRSAGAGPISLFAFQDIIFAATGVFLLVAILMTLLGKLDLLSMENLAETQALRKKLDGLVEEQVTLDKQLALLATATLPLKDKAASLAPADMPMEMVNPWLYTPEDLAQENAAKRDSMAALIKNLSAQVLEMNRMEYRLNLLLSGAYTAIDESGQAIVRAGRENDFREPVFITLEENRFLISYPGRLDLRESFIDQASFLEHVDAIYAPSTQSMLVYLKPSAIDNFDPLLQSLRDRGFALGYEPVPEAFELQ